MLKLWSIRNTLRLGIGKCHSRSHQTSVNHKSGKTDLLNQLHAKIRFKGPITIAEYMKEVLVNPVQGYYMKKDVFGSKGDFITSPEISQVFGELIAVWFIYEWTKMGRCKPLHIVELGPGRGTLADDMLRVFSKFPDVRDSVSLHLVEISPHLREIQRAKLSSNSISSSEDRCTSHHNIPVQWHNELKDVPTGFTCFMAHEFFDALPIHKFVRHENEWREILIDIDVNDGPHHLRYVMSRDETPATKLFTRSDDERNEFEVCPTAGIITEEISTRIVENGGCALIADYGHDGQLHDTFRAFKNHSLHDPLCEPGMADLTADVDFRYIKTFADKQALSFGPITQASFLKSVGIDLRMQNLMKKCSEEEKTALKTGYDMLINADKMGDRFKFLAIFPAVMKSFFSQVPPTGFTNSS